jgi:hypothetical protein
VDCATKYLDAIEEINRAERALDRSGSRPDRILRLNRAREAAEAAWKALAPDIRDKMSPPPARGIDS